MDRIIPVAREFASSAESAIDGAKRAGDQLDRPEYRDYFTLNAKLASDLSNVVGAWADYAPTRDAMDRVSQKMPAPGAGK